MNERSIFDPDFLRTPLPHLHQGTQGKPFRPIPPIHRDDRHLRRLSLGAGEAEEVRGEAERAAAEGAGMNGGP